MTPDVKGKAVTSGVKAKTKATGLKKFLSNLATDPRKLGEFLHEPEAAMSTANLSEEDKTALRSGVSGMIAARLAGVPLDKAFQLQSTMYVWYMKAAPEPAYMKQPPPQFVVYPSQWAPEAALMIHYIKVTPEPAYPPPQYVVYPPQFVVQPPPQYVVYPPQFVAQPPPQYVVYPPQFVVQPPPQYVVYPPQFVVQPPPYYPR